MKNYSFLMALAIAVVAFTACEDVPEPYTINTSQTNTDVLLSESFSSSLGKFQSKAASGNLEWIIDFSSAVITGYKDFDGDGKKENKAGVTYLVGPAIDLANVDAAYVSISQAINYEKNTIKDDHKLLASTNYTTDVNSATWVDLPLNFDGVGGSFTFVDQQVQIPSSLMGKKINIALCHIAHDTYSSTWEVKNFKVQRGQASGSGGSGGGGNIIFFEPFASGLGDFTIEMLSNPDNLESIWVADTKYSCAKATAFVNGTNHASEALLVSPVIDLTAVQNAILTFDHASKFFSQSAMNDCSLLVRELDEAGRPSDWLTATVPAWPRNDVFQFASSDDIDLKAFVGKKIQIAFRYTSTANTAGTWEIQNVKIVDSSSSGGGDTPTPVVGTEITCAEAVAIANNLADGATSTETYTITGYITEVVGSVSKDQQTFWMADTKDGGRVFEAYWANLPEGVSQFTAGTKVKITGQILKYVNKSTGAVTPEIKNATVTILEDSGDTPTPTPSGIEVTCAEAVTIANALADGATSEDTYTVTGYITELVGSVSKNQQTFWMADTKDGGRVFEAYWADLPEGVTQFTAGTKVKITGQILKYVNKSTGAVTPEIKNASVVIIEEGGGGTPTPAPSGIEVTCAEAVTLTNALADGGTSTDTYTVTGYITEVVGNVSRNQQTFWMADTKDGGRVFEAYWADLPEGVTQFSVGTKVKITGQLLKYVNSSTGAVTPEIKNASVVILEEGGDDPSGGGDTPTPGDDPTGDPLADFTNGGFEEWSDGVPTGWTTTSTICNATLSQDRDSHSGDYAVRVAGDSKNNKRLGSTEMTLPAGTYNCSFWVKSASGDAASICPGHAVAGSTITYNYDKGQDGKNRYINDIGGTWQQVSYSFTLNEAKKVSVIVMNSKNPGVDVLIDDFTITKQ